MQPVSARVNELCQKALLGLAAFAVLWRGGKGLEATWLFALIASGVVIATWAVGLSSKTKKETDQDIPFAMWLLLLLYLAWTCASFIFSKTGNYGFDEVLREAAQTLVFLWVARQAMQEKPEKGFTHLLFQTMTIMTFVACAVGLAVYLLQPVDRFVGTFFDVRFDTDYWPNAWGEFLLVTWPLIVFTIRDLSLWKKILLSGVLLGSLFLSYSRGSVLALCFQVLIIALMIGATHVWKKKPIKVKGKELVIQTTGTVVLAVALFFGVNLVRAQFHSVQSVSEKVTFTASEGTSSIDERSEFFREAFALSKDHPIIGYGPYSFRFVQPKLQEHVFATSDHPHNVFLKVAMERGWPALLLLVALIAYVAYAAISSFLVEKDATKRLMTGAALVSGAGLLAHLMIDYNAQFVAIALPFTMLAGFLASGLATKVTKRSIRSRSSWETAIAIILLLVTVREGYYLATSSVGRHAQASGDNATAITWYERSSPEWFSRDMLLSLAQLYKGANEPAKAKTAIEGYLVKNPYDARAWIIKGEVEIDAQKLSDAQNSFAVAMTLGQFNYLGATEGMLRTLTLSSSPKIPEFRPHLMQVMDAFEDAILKNSHFIALSSAVEDYVRLSRIAERAYPDDAEHFRTQTKRVQAHAAAERSRFSERKPGVLW